MDLTNLQEEIKREFSQIQDTPDPELIKTRREKQLQTFLLDFNESDRILFDSQIYQDSEIEKIKPILIFVKTPEQEKLFDYYRTTTSSMPQNNIPGHNCRLLVQDQITSKYLGILQLTTDLLNHPGKLDFLGIPKEKSGQFKTRLRQLGINISLCVPLQPFGYNYCGGKLLAMLAFSKPVYQYFERTYGTNLAYIITTSINGRSIQYSQLKELKYVGLTEGFGTSHIPDSLMTLVTEYLSLKYPRRNLKKDSKTTKLKLVIKDLNLDPMLLCHGQQRGVYIGLCGQKGSQYLKKEISKDQWKPDLIYEIEDQFQEWLQKYALKRKNSLLKRNLLK